MYSIVLIVTMLGAPASDSADSSPVPVNDKVQKEESPDSSWSAWPLLGRVGELVVASALTLLGACLLAHRAEWFRRAERADPLREKVWDLRFAVYTELLNALHEVETVCGLARKSEEEAKSKEPGYWIASGDLAHLLPKLSLIAPDSLLDDLLPILDACDTFEPTVNSATKTFERLLEADRALLKDMREDLHISALDEAAYALLDGLRQRLTRRQR